MNVGDIGGKGPRDSVQDPAPIPGNGTVVVSIIDNAGSNSYNLNPVEVKVGETVTWVNDDSNIYTATSNDGIFNSDVLFEGQSFSYTFDEEGEYPYFCDIHPNMVGTVMVVTQDGEPEA
ncbi:putative blue (Type 1) copper domain-containing protein [Candidatus Nitrososphaera gargensis Ga9.2]|uniref:Putative blue (Type 1) copper domain-containing protein n=1 Tax=Nitrososphaera gargensis (strain Ga9.2) TaxID=1237085 RepID=K0IM46_NITGG|nr:putative blue (Type 1) copper domain-containing protein [Candidatus Nitrososphaera gargensis Ga9.2]